MLSFILAALIAAAPVTKASLSARDCQSSREISNAPVTASGGESILLSLLEAEDNSHNTRIHLKSPDVPAFRDTCLNASISSQSHDFSLISASGEFLHAKDVAYLIVKGRTAVESDCCSAIIIYTLRKRHQIITRIDQNRLLLPKQSNSRIRIFGDQLIVLTAQRIIQEGEPLYSAHRFKLEKWRVGGGNNYQRLRLIKTTISKNSYDLNDAQTNIFGLEKFD